MQNKTGNNSGAIFQYRPPAIWALDNLFCGVIYFRSPLEFNDPHDCRTPPSLRGLTGGQLAFLRRTNPEFWGIPAENDSVAKGEFIAKINEKLDNLHGRVIRECGVACFSKRNDDLLMWAHYAGGGRGFCLEFGGDGDLPKGYDVDYSGVFPDAYHYVETLAKKPETVQYPELLLTHKNGVWKYEEEIRMFRGRAGKLSYSLESLKAVYLGAAATDCTKLLVRAIVREKYPHAAIMEGKPGREKSRVKFALVR